ncbi:lipid IV(A) palmitoyltransferase PagP [Bordetella genomosp. 1]|uniref:Phospholipid:lipid A palmitoyltransferase n=1 Tax=Bordetella genomosp. 1 TaxID=1395607 RepID=A0ABX4EYH7_9BORD|nr:lipid IV(A) palmitoyltransferase PagP [Bordetella genomosp. 1]MDQ8032111.1 lipid IV(A) palmitoyltransferase PagP [Bordetella sp.]OZI64147.1 phospholipid:lipid A palmitoyltransferase [Bordetella genomosp. 1]
MSVQRSTAVFVLWICLLVPASAGACDVSVGWMQRACNRIDQIWTTGDNDLYVTGWAWHNRSMYSAKKIREFNEAALGGGYGRSIFDEDGDWQGLYAMAFLDSHSRPQPIAGYGFLKIARVSQNWRLGAGYTAFLTAREDIMSYIPFPGVLPLVSAGYRDAMLFATYIPGKEGTGNVLFVFGKWTF